MATKTRGRSTGRAAKSAGRKAAGRGRAGRSGRGRAGRSGRGRGRSAPSGPKGLLNRITSTVGRSGGRGASRGGGRGASRGGGMASKGTNFVRGFLGGRGRGGRRR